MTLGVSGAQAQADWTQRDLLRSEAWARSSALAASMPDAQEGHPRRKLVHNAGTQETRLAVADGEEGSVAAASAIRLLGRLCEKMASTATGLCWASEQVGPGHRAGKALLLSYDRPYSGRRLPLFAGLGAL